MGKYSNAFSFFFLFFFALGWNIYRRDETHSLSLSGRDATLDGGDEKKGKMWGDVVIISEVLSPYLRGRERERERARLPASQHRRANVSWISTKTSMAAVCWFRSCCVVC